LKIQLTATQDQYTKEISLAKELQTQLQKQFEETKQSFNEQIAANKLLEAQYQEKIFIFTENEKNLLLILINCINLISLNN